MSENNKEFENEGIIPDEDLREESKLEVKGNNQTADEVSAKDNLVTEPVTSTVDKDEQIQNVMSQESNSEQTSTQDDIIITPVSTESGQPVNIEGTEDSVTSSIINEEMHNANQEDVTITPTPVSMESDQPVNNSDAIDESLGSNEHLEARLAADDEVIITPPPVSMESVAPTVNENVGIDAIDAKVSENKEAASLTPPPISETIYAETGETMQSSNPSDSLTPPPLPNSNDANKNDTPFEEYVFNQTPKKNKSKKKNIALVVMACCLALAVGISGGVLGSKFFYDSNKDSSSTVNNVIQTSDTSSLPGAVAKVAGPSVVEIQTETTERGGYFGQYTSQGAGSGVIYTEDGYIITNNHVVEGSTNIKVYVKISEDGKTEEYDAKVVGVDKQNDLAVLKIDAKGLTPTKVGKSGDMGLGDFVLAIGNPLGELGGTVTDGIISALDREIQVDGSTMRLLQTNAAVNPGNSGGGLFNSKGELIGIVNAKQSGSDVEGLGFAIPTDVVIPIVDDIIKNGGNHKEEVSNNNSVSLGVKISEDQSGVTIQEVIPDSPADKAGLQAGDTILRINKTRISSIQDLKDALSKFSYGDEIDVRIQRDGENETISLTF